MFSRTASLSAVGFYTLQEQAIAALLLALLLIIGLFIVVCT
jgi:hypothetical protein